MTLREITIDNSVRYIPLTEKTKEKDTKPKTTKAGSFHVNRTKNHHKLIKNFLKIFQHQDSNILQISICVRVIIQC